MCLSSSRLWLAFSLPLSISAPSTGIYADQVPSLCTALAQGGGAVSYFQLVAVRKKGEGTHL